jgi:hypothetical protein
MNKQLLAKPIIKDQYWVVTDGDRKVGNVTANNTGYELKLHDSFLQFNNTEELKEKTKIRFEPIKTNLSKVEMPYPEYPTPKEIYNSVFDIKRKLHLFTSEPKSKCQLAAGYFVVDQNGVKEVQFCPKYIFIQRYPYKGPFKTESEATAHINTQ